MLNSKTESLALLIHHNTETRSVEVTSHRVVDGPGGVKSLGAGRLFSQLDRDAMKDILTGSKSEISYMSSKVLARDASGLNMVWHTEPHMCEVRFRSGTYNVPMPMLVYAKFSNQPLRVFAVKGRKRPEMNTQLMIAPIGNIGVDGTMCSGNTNLPAFSGQTDMDVYESFALHATSTHLGSAKPVKSASSQDDYELFMKNLQQSGVKVFPASELVSLKMSNGAAFRLSDLIAMGGGK